jgi:hypothetical protein
VGRAPHPSAAQLFANWAAARAGGEVIIKALQTVSARRDVASEWAPTYASPRDGIQYLDTHSGQYLAEVPPAAAKGVRRPWGADAT